MNGHMNRSARATGIALALAGLAWIAAPIWAGGAKLKEGKAAPDIELPATNIGSIFPDKKDAKTLKLSDLKGKKNIVLWFYPKALTGGWTAEACGFRDRIEQFAQHDTVIIGISVDTLALQQKFTDKEKLPFPLLADSEKKFAKTYGVFTGKFASRATFVINKEGNITKIYNPVKAAGGHPEEVLSYVIEAFKKN